MGCVISTSMPGMTLRASSIFSISSSLVFADVHWAFGIKDMSMSARSTGMGSVGISELPMRVTACFTSGNCAFSIFSACMVLSTICESDVPCAMLISAAKSPSSRLGMNSPPNLLKTSRLIANSTTIEAISVLLQLRLFVMTGRYHPLSFSMRRSDRLRLCVLSLLRNNALAIGTYVSDRMNAPSMAKKMVIAMGRNIFPSIPASVSKGR